MAFSNSSSVSGDDGGCFSGSVCGLAATASMQATRQKVIARPKIRRRKRCLVELVLLQHFIPDFSRLPKDLPGELPFGIVSPIDGALTLAYDAAGRAYLWFLRGIARGALPPMSDSLGLLGFAASLLGASFCLAQQQQSLPQPDKAGEKAAEKPKDEKKPPVPEEKSVVTKHSIKIDGKEIKYTSTAGTILLKLEDGTPKASIFYVAYAKDDVADLSQRPITFSFNGGPGSSSVWLHLGLLGPRRVPMGDAGSLLPPPYKLADNDTSLLDVSELVFIDLVSTGYRRAVHGEATKHLHVVEEDVVSVPELLLIFATQK